MGIEPPEAPPQNSPIAAPDDVPDDDTWTVQVNVLVFVGLLEGAKRAALDALDECGEMCARHAIDDLKLAMGRCKQAHTAVERALQDATEYDAPCDGCEHEPPPPPAVGEA